MLIQHTQLLSQAQERGHISSHMQLISVQHKLLQFASLVPPTYQVSTHLLSLGQNWSCSLLP